MSIDAGERIQLARVAQATWAAEPMRDRVRVLRRLRAEIAARMDEIIQTISGEVGKPIMDALTGDVMVTLEQLKAYEKMAPKVLRSTSVRKPPFLYNGVRFMERFESYGVALIFAPWNYPLQLAVIPMATALVCGNAVVLKCSEHTPQIAALIEDICRGAQLPRNLVQVSCAPPAEAAGLIDAGPDLILFTGSTRGGRAVMERAAQRVIPVILELGGKDPALVFESCNLERAAAGVCYASFANAGQVCVSSKRVYVQHSVWEPFVRSFVAEVQRLRCGTSGDSDYGPLRISGVEERLREQVQAAIGRGAQLLTGELADVAGLRPIVLSGVPEHTGLLRDESFGPVVCLDTFDSEDEAIHKANASSFALSATVWTGDMRQGERVAAALNCGSCCINDALRHLGNPYASFGGNKASGFGRYRGEEGLRAFSRKKTVMFATEKRRGIHWFPFTTRLFNQLAFLVRIRHLKGLRKFSRRGLLGIALFTFGGSLVSKQLIPTTLISTIQVPRGAVEECASTHKGQSQLISIAPKEYGE